MATPPPKRTSLAQAASLACATADSGKTFGKVRIVAQLSAHAADIHASVLPQGTVFWSNVVVGPALSAIFGDPSIAGSTAAARAPNVFIQPNDGVIHSGRSKKFAEHGGGASRDTGVALVVAGGRIEPGKICESVTRARPLRRCAGVDPGCDGGDLIRAKWLYRADLERPRHSGAAARCGTGQLLHEIALIWASRDHEDSSARLARRLIDERSVRSAIREWHAGKGR